MRFSHWKGSSRTPERGVVTTSTLVELILRDTVTEERVNFAVIFSAMA